MALSKRDWLMRLCLVSATLVASVAWFRWAEYALG